MIYTVYEPVAALIKKIKDKNKKTVVEDTEEEKELKRVAQEPAPKSLTVHKKKLELLGQKELKQLAQEPEPVARIPTVKGKLEIFEEQLEVEVQSQGDSKNTGYKSDTIEKKIE